MYEQRNKDIDKARADTVYRLAKVLGCTMEDIYGEMKSLGCIVVRIVRQRQK